jgi:hypothetical protein
MQIMRTWMMKFIGVAGILCFAVMLAAASANKPVDVRDLMSEAQFKQAGLNKLSPDELKNLNAWLNRYLNPHNAIVPSQQAVTQAPMTVPAVAAAGVAEFGADTMVHKESIQDPTRIESRIAGSFTGWTGETVFKLENGQVWKQAATGYFTNVQLDHPQVVIKKLSFGYLLTLPGHGETVFVRRIK